MKVKKDGLLWLWIVAAIILLLETAAISATIQVSKRNDTAGNGATWQTSTDPYLGGWDMVLESQLLNGTWVDVGSCTSNPSTPHCEFGVYGNGTYRVREHVINANRHFVPTTGYADINVRPPNGPGFREDCLQPAVDMGDSGRWYYGPEFNVTDETGDGGNGTNPQHTAFFNWESDCSVTANVTEVCAGDPVGLIANATQGVLDCTQIDEVTWGIGINGTSFDPNPGPSTEWDSSGFEGNTTLTMRAFYDSGPPWRNRCLDQAVITVNPAPIVYGNVTQTEFCVDDPRMLLTGDPAGGNWTGTGVSANGYFIPSHQRFGWDGGQSNITYAYENEFGCLDTNTTLMTVNPIPNATITSTNGPYCEGDPLDPLEAEPANGTWGGTGVAYVNGTYWYDPVVVGVFNVTYDAMNEFNCTDQDIREITVNPAPTVYSNITQTEFCLDDPRMLLTGDPPGGNWTGTGVTDNGYFRPSHQRFGWDGGQSNITYAYQNEFGCLDANITLMTVFPLPEVEANGRYGVWCADDATPYMLNGTPVNGTWFGPGITDPNGTFTPAAIGAGRHNVTYNATDENGCFDTDWAMVDVAPVPILPENMNATICSGDFLTLPSSAGSYSIAWFEDACGGTPLNSSNVEPETDTVYYGQVSNPYCTNSECFEYEVKVDICANVPTLNEWGLIAFMMIMAATGAWYVIRKKRMA